MALAVWLLRTRALGLYWASYPSSVACCSVCLGKSLYLWIWNTPLYMNDHYSAHFKGWIKDKMRMQSLWPHWFKNHHLSPVDCNGVFMSPCFSSSVFSAQQPGSSAGRSIRSHHSFKVRLNKLWLTGQLQPVSPGWFSHFQMVVGEKKSQEE